MQQIYQSWPCCSLSVHRHLQYSILLCCVVLLPVALHVAACPLLVSTWPGCVLCLRASFGVPVLTLVLSDSAALGHVRVVRRFACSYFLHMELNLKRGYRAASLPVVTDTGLARTDSSAGEQKKKAVSSAGASAAQQPRAKRFEMATRHAFIAGCRDGEPCCRLRCWDRFDDVEWRAAILACQRGRTEMELTSFISNKLQALTRTKTGRFQYNLNGAPVCSVAWRSWLAVGQHKFRHAAAYIRWRRDALSDCASQSCSQVGAERGDYVSARQRRWRRGANGCVDRCCVV